MFDNTYIARRISFGLLAMLGVFIVLDLVPNPFLSLVPAERISYFIPLSLTWWSALEAAVAALAGAYLAKVPFAAVAAIFTAAAGLVSIKFLQYIAEPVQPVAFVDLLARNSLGVAAAILGAVIGAEIGLRLVQRKAESAPERV
jgi:hypothetical protein